MDAQDLEKIIWELTPLQRVFLVAATELGATDTIHIQTANLLDYIEKNQARIEEALKTKGWIRPHEVIE